MKEDKEVQRNEVWSVIDSNELECSKTTKNVHFVVFTWRITVANESRVKNPTCKNCTWKTFA